jgi:hypothetical protein
VNYTIDQINKYDISEDLKEKLIKIYMEFDSNGLTKSNCTWLKSATEEILESLFKTAFRYDIPMFFLDSNIGKILFQIRNDVIAVSEEVYSVTECSILSNKSRSAVIKDFNNNVIETFKVGGMFNVKQSELIKYLTEIGRNTVTSDEAKEKIELLDKLKKNNVSVVNIKTEFDYKK